MRLVACRLPSIRFFGRDMPKAAMMVVKHVGPDPDQYEIVMSESLAKRPAIQIPIIQTHSSSRRVSTSAVAVLERGSHDELVVSVSGWVGFSNNHYDHQIDNASWTPMVITMCDEIGHNLKKSGWLDRGVPGQHSACHAEKQLAAYLYYECTDVKSATIYCNKAPCADCKKFFSVLGKATGLWLRVVVGGTEVIYRRPLLHGTEWSVCMSASTRRWRDFRNRALAQARRSFDN